MRQIQKTIVPFFLSFFLLSATCLSQDLPPDLPEYDPVFEHFRELRDDYQDPIPELDRIISENPGTKIDAYARLQKAAESIKPGNIDVVLPLLGSIIADFPGSREAMFARANKIDYHYDTNFELCKAEMDELFRDAGAPPLEELWSGDTAPRQAPPQLNSDEHEDICAFLIVEAGDIYFEKVSSEMVMNLITYLVLNYSERFDREFCANAMSQQIDHELNPDLEHLLVESMDAPEFVPPVLTFEPPFVNGAIVESPVRVKIRAQDGTLSESSLMDLTSAEFIVDGQKVEQLYGKSTIENGRWECVLSIEEDFAPGEHHGVFRLSDSGENEAEIEFSFIVKTSANVGVLATKDTTLRAQKPHRNEGTNPHLFLSHRLDARDRSHNPLVGFELSNIDLSGLTKATLVMNIQDCDLPRRWGRDGRLIEVHPVATAWVEGNGNTYRTNQQEGRDKGEGPGATWFSPVDDKIQNNRPNGSEQWNGARNFAGYPTAPAVQVVNRQTGPIEFDVTQDVLQAAGTSEISWLLQKQDESEFGNVRFYSKESGSEVAPKLILEFGGPIASEASSNDSLLSAIGLGSIRTTLQPKRSGGELRSVREILQDSPVAALAAEQFLCEATRTNPVLNLSARTAYRSWLAEDIRLAAAPSMVHVF